MAAILLINCVIAKNAKRSIQDYKELFEYCKQKELQLAPSTELLNVNLKTMLTTLPGIFRLIMQLPSSSFGIALKLRECVFPIVGGVLSCNAKARYVQEIYTRRIMKKPGLFEQFLGLFGGSGVDHNIHSSIMTKAIRCLGLTQDNHPCTKTTKGSQLFCAVHRGQEIRHVV